MYTTTIESCDPKALGAFYTPATIAGILANWVVQTGAERLLEPSVGEGALVEAAIARAQIVGGRRPSIRILACDINSSVIEAVARKLPPPSEVRAIDFLQLEVARTGLFQGVIANPPFTRNHSIPPKRRAVLRKQFGVTGAAGLWVHFLLHAVEFLAAGGRLAAIIPASGLFTRYGRSALERIAARFQSFEIRQIADKPLWKNGAEERGAIILAAGFQQGASVLPEVKLWSEREIAVSLHDSARDAFDRLTQVSTPLGELALLRIGAVTGCNSVFLMNEADRSKFGIDHNDMRPIASRSRHVPGLTTSLDDLKELGRQGERTWLLQPRDLGDRGSPVRKRLALISPRRRRHTIWFSKRRPWWRVATSDNCDAIFTYMNDYGPRIVLTEKGVCATNTLHEMVFQKGVQQAQKLTCALSMVSTFGQLAAERFGRSYGGGLLKFELSDARKLPILPAPAGELEVPFRQVHTALRDGDLESARVIADEVVLSPVLGSNWRKSVSTMSAELVLRRSLRQGRKV